MFERKGPRGVADILSAFGTDNPGSIPGGVTIPDTGP